MAKLKKGSEAAKAWGRKMKALRNSKSKEKLNKPVLNHNGKVKPKMSEKNDRKPGKKRTTIHVVPDLLFAAGAVEFAGPLVDDLYYGWKDAGVNGFMKGLDWYVTQQMVPAAVPAAELAVAGIIAKKAAKWLGINRVGTKNIKVF